MMYLKFIGNYQGLDRDFINDLEYYNNKIPIIQEYSHEYKVSSRYRDYWVILKSDKRFVETKLYEVTLSDDLFEI